MYLACQNCFHSKVPLLLLWRCLSSTAFVDRLPLHERPRGKAVGDVDREEGHENDANQQSSNADRYSKIANVFNDALDTLEKGSLSRDAFVESARRLLTQFSKEKNKRRALRLHAILQKHGYEVHSSLGNYLVPMLVEVGSISDAQNVFDRLVSRNDWSWNSLISGYVRCGKPLDAFLLFEKMQKGFVPPNEHTFVSLVKACSRLKDLDKGIRIHGIINEAGFLKENLFLSTTVIDMYAKCGSLSRAQQLFDTLPNLDVVCWNALIMGYAEHSHGKLALKFAEEMECQGFSPNSTTFVGILKACGSIGAVQKGQEIHARLQQQGLLESDIVIGNALVDMYAKCGILDKAEDVFSRLPFRDVIAWTSLISGYVEHDRGEKALACFEKMLLGGVCPDVITFLCALRACGDVAAIEKGQQIHAEIERQGLLIINEFIGRTLVDMYAKCCLVGKAQEVFDRLPVQNVVSWTSLIAGYVEHGHSKEALNIFEKMQLKHVSPDGVTFVCALKACADAKARKKGQEIHAEIERNGLLESNLILGNALLDMYVKCGSIDIAQEIFDLLPIRDVVSWNTLITGYLEHGDGEKAVNCFDNLQSDDVHPNATTFICTLKACGNIGDIDKGEQIRSVMERRGLIETDIIVGSALIDMYAKCGLMTKAQQVFDILPVHDVVTWNLLISAYSEHECGEEALKRFEQMQVKGVSPDPVTFVCCLKACGTTGASKKGGELHADIERRGLLDTNLVIGNSLIDMYSKCGVLNKAQVVFDELPLRDVVSWTALMAGQAHLGECNHVFETFDRMLREGVKPNPVTFIVILCACSRKGLFSRIQTYFEAMSEEYGILPAHQHHNCMIDLFGRSGELDIALAIVRQSSFCTNHVMLRSVLCACKNWGNVKCGQLVFERTLGT